MTVTWDDGNLPALPKLGVMGWLRVLLRGLPLLIVLIFALIIHGIVRLLESVFVGPSRPISAGIVQWVCRAALRLLGLTLRLHGDVMTAPGAVVANHSSWLDIFVLNARKRIFFVAKSEVRGWPGIGWLARAAGTVFIKRDRKEARAQVELFRQRLGHGHRLLFFPEGTSTDNQRVLPFKTTLFAPFFDESLRDIAHIQAVSVIYHATDGQDQRFYGWWGDMSFGGHLLSVLGARGSGSVDVVCHPPHKISEYADRKVLAADLERCVRQGFEDYQKG
jgi:1-acyl-sn-glycerol-3-phosphate acyltransferase